MKCKDCGTEMKPLFQGYFCPNDCDKPEGKARNQANAAKAKAEADAEAQRRALDELQTFWLN